MLHTHDDFLNAIQAQPADRTLRLVYADWLDECNDPRGELIRAEEEMRQLPVFADRFWELKPRRNELRAHAGSEWCGKMRYGTECEPVFRHGIPEGWRERWRLIREFTERWHRIPMSDIGGRQTEIIEAEARLGRRLPPSVREHIAYVRDTRQHEGHFTLWHGTFEIEPVPGLPAISLFGGRSGYMVGYRHADDHEPDPPMDRFIWAGEIGVHSDYALASDWHESSVTNFVFRVLLLDSSWPFKYVNKCFPHEHDQNHLLEGIKSLPVTARWCDLDLYEADNVLLAFWKREEGLEAHGRIASHIPEESLPTSVRELIEWHDGRPIPF